MLYHISNSACNQGIEAAQVDVHVGVFECTSVAHYKQHFKQLTTRVCVAPKQQCLKSNFEFWTSHAQSSNFRQALQWEYFKTSHEKKSMHIESSQGGKR